MLKQDSLYFWEFVGFLHIIGDMLGQFLLPLETVEDIVLGTISLHNFLRERKSRHIYSLTWLADAEGRNSSSTEGLWCRAVAKRIHAIYK